MSQNMGTRAGKEYGNNSRKNVSEKWEQEQKRRRRRGSY
jgi:hypothetical protein